MLVLPNLSRGSRIPEVGNLQRFLNERGMTDPAGSPLVADEDFGSRTEHALKQWQARSGLNVTGAFTRIDRALATKHGYIAFLQAKHFRAVPPKTPRGIRVIVIHTMEYPERDTTAEWCAQFFTDPHSPKGPVVASAHYNIDNDSIVQSVRDRDIAYGAAHANQHGLHFEHAGFARQTEAEWMDGYSLAMLENSAKLAAKKCVEYGIAPAHLSTGDALRAALAGVTSGGFCAHDLVSRTFGGSHWDPGPAFPWQFYMSKVRSYLRAPEPRMC